MNYKFTLRSNNQTLYINSRDIKDIIEFIKENLIFEKKMKIEFSKDKNFWIRSKNKKDFLRKLRRLL